MYELKPISGQAIARAVAKAERYRLLNEPQEAESICRDILRADPDNQEVLAMLLLSLTGIMRLTRPLFSPFGHPFSGRDLILLLGGLFLLWKSTREIHDKLEGEEGRQNVRAGTFGGVIVQIALLDIVFSLDSVITAVGMVRQVGVMIAAIVLAVLVMLVAAGPISDFVHRHPTLKMLALSFLLLIGVTLIADGLGQHIPKGYVYFAMGFSVFVESLNLRLLRKVPPVHLKESITP